MVPVILLLLLAVLRPGWAATYFVDTTRPDNSGACTSEGTACQTILGGGGWDKMQALGTCGHTIKFHGNGQIHRVSNIILSSTNCSASNQIVLDCYNCGTALPIISGSTLTTSGQWSVHAGSGCTGASPNDCTWKMTTSTNPGRMVFQNADNPPTVRRNGDVISGGALANDFTTPMHARWADAATSAGTCPSALTKRHQFCWASNTLYLRSRGNPATTFTEPGVEVLQTPGTSARPLVAIENTDGYTVKNIHLRHANSSVLKWNASTRSINHAVVQNVVAEWSGHREALFGNDPWTGNSGGSVAVTFIVDPSRTINFTIDTLTITNPGRDGFHISHSGTATYDIKNVWIKEVFNHNPFYIHHEGDNPSGVSVRNGTVDRLRITDTCNSTSGNPAIGVGSTTYTNFLIENTVDVDPSDGAGNLDPRMPTGHECNGANGQAIWTGNAQYQQIYRRGLIIGDRWQRGLYAQHAGVTTLENVTIHGMSKAGIGGNITAGQAVILRRSALTGIPSGASGTAPIALSNTTVTTAGDFNAFRNTAGTDQMARAGSTNFTLAQWVASAQSSGDVNSLSLHGSPLSAVYVNADAENFNPVVGSPLLGGAASNTSPCVGPCEIGAFEVPVIATGATTANNTWDFPVSMLVPPVVLASATCAQPRVNGDTGRTGTLSVLNNTTVRLSHISGPAPSAGATLTAVFSAGCIKDSMNLGNASQFTNQSLAQTVTVTNTIIPPVLTSCTVEPTDTDGVVLTFSSGGSSPMKPAAPTACTQVEVDDNSSFTSPDSLDSCLRIGTTDSFLADLAVARVAGQDVWVRITAGTNLTNQANTPLAVPVTRQCVNNLVPAGDTWFVRTTGSDSNTCAQAKVVGTPKASITAGAACLEAGGTLDIGAGTYVESLNLNNVANGLSTKFTTLKGAGSGPVCTVAGVCSNAPTTILKPTTPIAGGGLALRVGNARRFVRLERLAVDMADLSPQAAENDGVVVRDGSHHIVFESIEIKNITGNNEDAFAVTDSTTHTVTVQNSWIHAIDDGDSSSNPNHAIYNQAPFLGQGGQNQYLNNVLESRDAPINLRTGSGNTLEGAIIRGNILRNGQAQCLENSASPVTGGLIANNICTNVQTGFTLLPASSNVKIYHNTIHQTTGGGTAGACFKANGSTAALTTAQQALVKNNICSSTSQESWVPADNFVGDPSFVNAASGDFTLQSGSGARNTRACQPEVTTDKNGVTRPVGALCDDGAYEFDTPDTTPPQIIAVDPPGVVAAGGLTLPAGTTTLTRCVTTNESAVCKLDGQSNEDFDVMGGTMTATGTTHCLTHSSLTDGASHVRFVRCEDTSGNENPANLGGLTLPLTLPANGVRLQYNVAFPEPTVAQCRTENVTPDKVRCTINLFGSSPVAPTNNCTGWTGLKQGVAWPMEDCDADGPSTIVLDMATNLARNDVATVTYTTGTGTPVTNAAGQELVGGTFPVENAVLGIAPELLACEIRDSAPTEIVWDFAAGAPGAMTGTNCTSLSATRNGSAYTQTDCDPTGNTQFRTVQTPAAVFGDVIRGIITQGTATPILNADGIEVAAVPAPGLLCTNHVGAPPAAPMLSSLRVADAEPTTVKVLITTEAPLLPTEDCVGFTFLRNRHLGQGDQPWAVTDCTLEPPSTMLLTMEDALVFGDTYMGTYTTQGGAVAGRVRDQNGTQLASFTGLAGQNLVEPPIESGTVSLVNIRCRAADVAGSTFTQGETLPNGALNGRCELAAGATFQVFVEIQCDPGVACAETGYEIQACDNGACDSGGNLDHDAAGWYSIPNAGSAACSGRNACFGEDRTVTNQAPTTGCLSGATRDAGVYLKNGAAGVVPTFVLAAGRCAQYVAVIALQSTLGVDGTVDFRVATSNGMRLANYPSGQPGRVQVTSTGQAMR